MSRNHDERGSALVFAVVIVLLLLGVSSAFVSTSLSRYSAARTALEVERAQNAAEAGLDTALFEIQNGNDFGIDGIGVCAGTIDGTAYSATVNPAYTGPGLLYTVRAVGSLNQVQKGIEAVISPAAPRLTWGLFTQSTMSMSGSFGTDSYDSTKGTYLSQVGPTGYANSNGTIASNGAINDGGGIVHGNATPGVGFSVSNPAKVTGSTAPATEPVTLPAYNYVPSGANLGSVTFGTPKVLPPGTYHYTNLTVSGGGASLTLTGNTTIYVDTNFTMSGGSELFILNGANVEIHHGTGKFTVSGGGFVNTAQDPHNLTIYSATSDKFTLSGSSDCHGMVFAPKSQFVASGGSGLFGAIFAKTAVMSAAGMLHFDESLSMPGTIPELQISMVLPFHP